MKIIGDSMYGNVVQLRIGDICSFGVTGVVVGGGGKIRKVTPWRISCHVVCKRCTRGLTHDGCCNI